MLYNAGTEFYVIPMKSSVSFRLRVMMFVFIESAAAAPQM
jgi:hypothetical protein